ncbi:hypothetical protein Efla_000778 [Eimeria flavescens]
MAPLLGDFELTSSGKLEWEIGFGSSPSAFPSSAEWRGHRSALQAGGLGQQKAHKSGVFAILLIAIAVVKLLAACYRGLRARLRMDSMVRALAIRWSDEDAESDQERSEILDSCLQLQEEIGYSGELVSILQEKEQAVANLVSSFRRVAEQLDVEHPPSNRFEQTGGPLTDQTPCDSFPRALNSAGDLSGAIQLSISDPLRSLQIKGYPKYQELAPLILNAGNPQPQKPLVPSKETSSIADASPKQARSSEYDWGQGGFMQSASQMLHSPTAQMHQSWTSSASRARIFVRTEEDGGAINPEVSPPILALLREKQRRLGIGSGHKQNLWQAQGLRRHRSPTESVQVKGEGTTVQQNQQPTGRINPAVTSRIVAFLQEKQRRLGIGSGDKQNLWQAQRLKRHRSPTESVQVKSEGTKVQQNQQPTGRKRQYDAPQTEGVALSPASEPCTNAAQQRDNYSSGAINGFPSPFLSTTLAENDRALTAAFGQALNSFTPPGFVEVTLNSGSVVKIVHPPPPTPENTSSYYRLPAVLPGLKRPTFRPGAGKLRKTQWRSIQRSFHILRLLLGRSTVDEGSSAVLMTTALVILVQLFGPSMHPQEWFPTLVESIPTTYRYSAELHGNRPSPFTALALRLSAALSLLKQGIRPPLEETVGLKQALFLDDLSPNCFKSPMWDDWRVEVEDESDAMAVAADNVVT